MKEKNEILADVSQWKRNISLHDDRIVLKTESAEGVTHAFYLEHNNNELRKFYIEASSWSFEINPVPGQYLATFFYKYDQRATSIKVPFWITEAGNIVFVNHVVIASGERYRIDNYDIGSDITFVVFNGSGSTLDSAPFGCTFLLRQGYNVIACFQDDDQYQSLSFEDFGKFVSPHVINRKVFLYGSSLGGYCAVYYAGAIDGHVIAAAPRNSAHPKIIERLDSQAKYDPKSFLHKEVVDNRISSGNIYIFMDPRVSLDKFFFNECVVEPYPQAKILPFEFAGHEVLLHVNRTGQLKGILKQIVALQPEIEIDTTQESEYTFAGRAWMYYRKKNAAKAIYYANKAIKAGLKRKKLKTRMEMIIETCSTKTI